MKNLDETVEEIVRETGLDQEEIAQRQAYLDITEADIALLQQVDDRLHPHQHQLVNLFNKQLFELSSISALLAGTGTFERLKGSHSDYLGKLIAGECGPDYVKGRLRVGLVHQRIGFEPKWYIGAYRKYLSELMPILWQLMQDDTEKFLLTYDALLKVVCLDMTLALDTYFRVDGNHIHQPKGYAEQIVTHMPSGLLVIDSALNIRTINRAMCAMIGHPEAVDVSSTPLSGIIQHHDLFACLQRAIETGKAQTGLVLAMPEKSGVRHIEFNISTSLLTEKNVLLLMAQDITDNVQSEEKLRRFRMALDSSIDAIFLVDYTQMRFIDVNETASATLGYSQQELLKLGPQDLEPDLGALERIYRRFAEVIQSDSKTGIIETVYQRKNSVRLPVEVYLRAVQSEGRQLLVAVVRDISTRIRAEMALRESEERFRVAFSQAAVGLAHVAPNGCWLMANQKLCEIVGYSQNELLGLNFRELTHPDDLPADLELGRQMLAREIHEKSREKRYRHRNGRYIWVNITSSLVWDADGKPKYYSTVIEDISRRKQIEGELLHLANHDVLTSLPNRSLLLDRLSQALAYANRLGEKVAVILIDLDRFKNINDSLGHDVGDKIIMGIGRRLSSIVREGDTIARLGGDEFVVVLADIESDDAVSMLAQQVLETLSQPMTIQDHEFYPAGSIGISLFPKDGLDSQTLLKNADTAMYRAKEKGRNNFQFYAQEMNARALDRLKLEGGLRHALERDEFVLHYQPQMEIATQTVIGVEALLRWQPLGQAMISPEHFISIAEETGLIVPIGEWVLRKACTQQKLWESSTGFPNIRVAVNLSAVQFKQQDIVKMVSRILAETGCRPSSLELEITESIVMENPEMAAEILQQLSDMGVYLSIDDFGTGYSSLSYLKRFPINALKIDKSFVCDLTTDSDDAAIAKAIIALAHSMKLKVVAEGVETAEQLDFLRQQQCDQMQGNFFSKAAPADQIEKLLFK